MIGEKRSVDHDIEPVLSASEHKMHAQSMAPEAPTKTACSERKAVGTTTKQAKSILKPSSITNQQMAAATLLKSPSEMTQTSS
mmetsp:Transcript_26522/g.33076  ORF Transcript_26522/g.33076 Transcript_26522/m.33076 type:complete len:83 (+) Transcript_26522:42-290(+)|eukprot:CAMPEP_0170465812 /NCGR_PEP_ID=MMETSP0123-20130129/10011_1 /TAXON_ID=182087 /ORGANISM="Favella ehrenbergii, Strain Fehren 1" /LENGTH=82 /DNA_ID=CAMNT_0010731793 /DNA_START=42 /DNA_END=290 /DNA_ORIENTATION=+